MKKIYTLIISIICFQFIADAQQFAHIPDTAVLRALKDVESQCKAYYSNFVNTHVPGQDFYSTALYDMNLQCFNGDTMNVDAFKQITGADFYYEQPHSSTVNIISLANKGIISMEGLQYIGCHIRKLDLSNNQITNAGYRNISNPDYYHGYFAQIGTLDLSHNLLSDTFTISGTCWKLNLSYNAIKKINFNLFFNQIEILGLGGSYYDAKMNFSHNNLDSVCNIPPLNSNAYASFDYSYNNIKYFSCTAIGQGNGNYTSSPLKELNLSYNPNLFLPSNAFTIAATYNAFAYKFVCLFPDFINLSHCNLTEMPELVERKEYSGSVIGMSGLDISGNDIYCLPKLPPSVTSINFDTNKITCVPNGGTFSINGGISSSTYPVCNPTNNMSGCKGYPTFIGNVYLDENNNGIKDATEIYLEHFPVKWGTSKVVYADDNGGFAISADSIRLQTINFAAPQYYTAFPSSFSYDFLRYDTTIDAGSIGVRVTTVFSNADINIIRLSGGARRGSNFSFVVDYINTGTTKLNPTISVAFDSSILSFVSCSEAGAINNGNNISFGVSNLKTFHSGTAVYNFTVKTTAPLGASINTTAKLVAGSFSVHNTMYGVIVGSFDPNEKEATPELSPTQVSNEEYIDYTIHFQNTGNDTAFNIVVADTLSNKLQAGSFQMIASSHKCKTTLQDNKVYFELKDVLLPDSNVNKAGSNGFVRYRVKPISSLSLGDIIPNTASIYFDYNAPVVTNTATTIIKNIITPVKFTMYEASPTPPKEGLSNWTVLNKWTTSTEINTSHFNVQRSEDGRLFKTVGTVAAKGVGEYHFTDPLTINHSPFTIYYRLQAVDKDGQTSYSEIRKVELGIRNAEISLYPNPTKDNLTIDSKGVKKITVTDCFGRIVLQLNYITEHQTINAKQWNKGMYIVSFDNGEKVKVMKE